MYGIYRAMLMRGRFLISQPVGLLGLLLGVCAGSAEARLLVDPADFTGGWRRYQDEIR